MTAEKVPKDDPNLGKQAAKVACDSHDVETATLAQPTRGRQKDSYYVRSPGFSLFNSDFLK